MFSGEKRRTGSHVHFRVELRANIYFSGKVPIPTGPHGTKPIPSSSQVSSTPLFSGSLFMTIFSLDCRHRLNRMRSADRFRTCFRETEVQNFSRFDQILNCAGYIFDWHFRINPVLVIEIDVVGSEALQRFLNHFPDVLWLAIKCRRHSRCRSQIWLR